MRLFQSVTKFLTYLIPLLILLLIVKIRFKQKTGSQNIPNNSSQDLNSVFRKYQICTRCVMDTSDIAITFNAAGECNHCIEYLEKRINFKYNKGQSELKLNQLLSEIKASGKGKQFDVLVGLSGGLDSSYVAYLCKKLDLRVLAVHVDNGWNSKDSVQNIINITQKLNIAYDSYVLDWEEFKDVQLAFLKASVPEAETPSDIALLAALHHVANKYDIKYLISGGNLATEGILPKHWHYDAKDGKYFSAIYHKFGTQKLKKFPFFGFATEAYYKLVKKIKIIYLLNYVNYVKEEVTQTLKKEIDWHSYGQKHHESIYTKFIQSYYLFNKFGIDYRRATFSSRICTGDMKREDALLQLKTLPYDENKIQSDIEYVCKKLGIKTNEFHEIMKQPVKWYSDYPNNEKKLKFIYDMYRKIFKKEKLGNF
ncbi:MAG: N-acetyl sugar amidotransferase [Sphingobacteriaceae bacterium]|nr:N-acetyl sugar amidotransferase [Sphingobacteriaceae bacterium]